MNLHEPTMKIRVSRVRHSNIWVRILIWLRLFERSPTKNIEILHVKAHAGEHGNERADALAKKGVELCFKLMELSAPPGWFHSALDRY